MIIAIITLFLILIAVLYLNRQQTILKLAKENVVYLEQIRSRDEYIFRLEGDINEMKTTLQDANDKRIELHKTIAEYTTKNSLLTDNIQIQKEDLDKTKIVMKIEFENLANKILEQKSKDFTTVNRDSLNILLRPLGDSIKEFKTKIEQNLMEETKQRSSLQEQVKTLVTQTNSVSQEAHNLTQALKGKSKTRGNWGEMILEAVLKQAGLVEGRDYETQKRSVTEELKILIPDIVINLPHNRTMVVDSKVSLVDYEQYCTNENELEQKRFLKQHISSLKGHIDELSKKEYNKGVSNSADFTMMFIPIEPAYMAALEQDAGLWEYAYHKEVMLVSPSNLLPCLKLINDLWHKEKITQNAKDIVSRGEKMYNQLVSVMESFDKVGNLISKAQDEFNTVKNKMNTGKSNLMRQAEQLRALGLKPKRMLKIVEEDIIDVEEQSDIEVNQEDSLFIEVL